MGNLTKDAVILHSQQRNTDLLKLLLILADGADDTNGIVDPAPTRETLAELLACTPRAITARTKKLLNSNELKRLRMGSGKGHPSAFQIMLPIADTPMLSAKKPYKSKASTTQRLEKAEADINAIFELLQQFENTQRVKQTGEDETYEGGSEKTDRVKQTGEGETYEGGSESTGRVKGGSKKGEASERVERPRSSYDPLRSINDPIIQPPPPTPSNGQTVVAVAALMDFMEIVNQKTRTLISQAPAELVLTWFWYGLTQTWADNPTSVTVKQFQENNTPPQDLLDLATIWLEASLIDRAVMLEAAGRIKYQYRSYKPFSTGWIDWWEEALISVSELTWEKLISNQKSLLKFEQLADTPQAFAWEGELAIDGYSGESGSLS